MEITSVPEKHTLMIRTITPFSVMPQLMDTLFGELVTYMKAHTIAFDGPPYTMYYNMDMEALDIEVGFPVSQIHDLAPDAGRVKKGCIPAGTVVTGNHIGSYETMEKTYIKIMEFAKQQGIEVHESWMYEFYLNSPEDTPPDQLQTQIYFIAR